MDREFCKSYDTKLKVIHSSLLDNDYVLYIDGDIVIKKNIQNYLLNKIQNKDVIFQNDEISKTKPN